MKIGSILLKKVLIITHGFPGYGARGNVKLIKYLPRFGYEPIIITNRAKMDKIEEKVNAEELNNGGRIYKTACINKSPFRIFSKLFHSWSTTIFFEKLFFIPDLYINWVPSAVFKGLQIIKHEEIGVIITASPPESLHITGLLLSKITGVKWITDFRDLWTKKLIVNNPPTWLHKILIKEIEKCIYKNTDHIIANTHGNKDVYINSFHLSSKKITVITNGYDPEEVSGNDNRGRKRNEFLVGYMGFFDKPGFPWSEFLLAVKELILNGKNKVKINLYGYLSDKAKNFIEKNDLLDFVCFHGMLPHFEAFQETRKNDLLLLLMYETDYSGGIVPHKLYHYLGMLKPIMAIAEQEGEVANIIKATNTGKVISQKNTDEIYNILSDFYDEWEFSNYIKYEPINEELAKYDVIKLTEKLSRLLETCSSQT